MGAQASQTSSEVESNEVLFPKHGKQVADFFRSHEGARLQLHYGMYLMSFKVLIDLPRMTAHQVLLHQGRLTQWSEEHAGRVIFVSHEWLGFAHPDPIGEQLAALKSTILRLARGQVEVQSDWKYQLNVGWNEKLTTEHATRVIANCSFWLDYSGVPQRLSEQDLNTLGPLADTGLADDGTPLWQVSAIHSIPAYVERSSLVFVLSPACKHQDRTAFCDVSTWRARGWCRMELLCAVLARTNVRLMKCDAASGDLEFMAGTDAIILPPGTGAFTCCARGHKLGGLAMECDKVKLRGVVENMLEAKVSYLQACSDKQMMRLLAVDKERYLRGFPAVTPPGHADPVEALQKRLFWTAKDDAAARAREAPSLLHWAARAGDAPAIERLLLQSRHGLEHPVPRGILPAWCVAHGLRPLHLAACSADGRADAMLALLDARADATAWDASPMGQDAFMWATAYGTEAQIKAWLKRFPDWDFERRTEKRGITAFSLAAFVGPSSSQRLRILMDAGASPRIGSGVGSLVDAALLSVCKKDDSDPEAARLLLEAKCSPNVIGQPCMLNFRMLNLVCRVSAQLHAVRGKTPGPVALRLSELDGASALGWAAFSGHLDVVQVLLQAEADPSHRNRMGRTPLESARHRSGGRTAPALEALLTGVLVLKSKPSDRPFSDLAQGTHAVAGPQPLPAAQEEFN